MKKEAINTFSEGMSLDSAPLSTQSSVLTHSLNGTLITRNGNEFVLQNDMGNGRVETAFLPAGFVPVGVKEHGGIIYVASHNPLTNKNQLGSFPSPERNIMEEDIKEKNKELVKIEKNEFYTDTLKSVYIKKGLLDEGIKIRPGDKFLIGVEELHSGSLKYVMGSEETDDKFPQFIRLHLAVIDDNNVISYLEEEDDKNYLTPIEVKKEGDDVGGDFTLENYRNFIDNNYIVYTNKVSGTLAIIAELEALNSYEVSWNYDITKIDKEKKYNIKLAALNSWDTNSINPYGITHELNIEAKGFPITISYSSGDMQLPNNIKQLPFPEKDGTDPNTNDLELSVSIDDLIKKPLFKYKSTPSMFYGPMNHLSREGVVDLSKINSGIIDLTSYRYYVDNNTLTITWGINSYLKEYQSIESIKLQYISFKDAQNVSGKLNWEHSSIKEVSLKNRINYTGIFNDVFVFGEVFEKNEFYLTRIVINVTENNELVEKYLTRERFLYTTGLFNDYYVNHEYNDFNEIEISGNINVRLELDEKPTKVILSNHLDIADNLISFGEQPLDKSLSFIRSDFSKDYAINKKVQITDEFGKSRFYGEHQFDNVYNVKTNAEKDKITHSLDERDSYKFVGTGSSSSELEALMKFDVSDAEYIGLEEEQDKGIEKHQEKYSIKMLDDLSFRIFGQEVRKAYFKQGEKEIIFNRILRPIIDTYDQSQLYTDLYKLLGTTNFKIKDLTKGSNDKSELNIKHAFGLNGRTSSRADYKNLFIGKLNDVYNPSLNFQSYDTLRMDNKGSHADFKDDGRQQQAFYEGVTNLILTKLCERNPTILNDPYTVGMFLGAYFDGKSARPFNIFPTNNVRTEMKGEFDANLPSPLVMGMPVIQKVKGKPGFFLVDVKTSAHKRDGGNIIRNTTLSNVGAYNKTMLNLIVTLYSQIYKFTKNESETKLLNIPNGIVHHLNNLETNYNYNLNINIEDKNNDNYLFGDFNQDYFKRKLSGLIQEIELNNIPNKESFKLTSNSHKEYKTLSTNLSNVNLLLNELDIASNITNDSTLAYYPKLEAGGVVPRFNIISITTDSNLYYYDEESEDFKVLPKNESTPWLYDHDFANLLPGTKPQVNNLGKYLVLNSEGIPVLAGTNVKGRLQRGQDDPVSKNHRYFSDIHDPYIFDNARIFKQ